MKKILSAVFALCLCLVCFVGCTFRDPNEEKGKGDSNIINQDMTIDANYEATIKVAIPDVQSHKNALNAFIESFNVKYPKIKFNVTPLTLDNYKTLVQNAASSAIGLKKPELMYDVFWLNEMFINEWVLDTDFISPLSEIIEKDSSFSLDGINETMLDMCKLNGKLYMMPRDYNQVVMYYNKDMFTEARVPFPSDTEAMSGAEFKAMCEELARGLSNNKTLNSYGQPYSDQVRNIVDVNVAWNAMDYPLVASFGGSVVDSKGNVVFDSQESADAISYWWDFVNGPTVGNSKLAVSIKDGSEKNGTPFRMQTAPIYFHTRAVMSDLLDDYTATSSTTIYGIPNLGVAPVPNFGGTYKVGAGCSGYAMYKSAANSKAAYNFLKHIVSVEGQNAYSETGDCVPVLDSMIKAVNAKWRTCRTDKLPFDFNHGAFVYKMNEAACSVKEFYENVPVKAQTLVTARIEEAFRNGIGGNLSGVKSAVANAANKMKQDIAQNR